ITYRHFQQLKKAKLSDIRFSLCGTKTKNQVFNIDDWWDEKAIELEVGDLIVSQHKLSIDGPLILDCVNKTDKYIYEAKGPGITRIFNDKWSSFTKISRHKFQGFYQYKYDEEEE
ncbi:MAG: hypothetical protein RLO81_00730, partial [Fulvivirga sp.]|uniref:hypothetical protein n=1 Tax=Fulvivirga sp. TaxID=1931237 RepID=UPI0032F08D0A